MSQRLGWCVLAVWSAAACSRSFPDPPSPQAAPPIHLVGEVVVQQPGIALTVPAPGAQVQMLATNLATVANAAGNFALGPLPGRTGTLLVSLAVDGGAPLQRLFDLALLSPNTTGDIEAGQLLLGADGAITGTVTLAGPPTTSGAITVFVPGTPLSATPSATGQYLLSDVPAGVSQVSAVAPGYAAATVSGFDLQAGQLLSVEAMTLHPAPAGPAAVNGVVLRSDQSSAAGISVALAPASGGSAPAATTAADGSWSIASLPAGLYTLTASLAGVGAATLHNIYLPPDATTDVGTLWIAPGQGAGFVTPPASDAGQGVDAGAPDAGSRDGGATPTARCADVEGMAAGYVQLDGTGSTSPAGDGGLLLYDWTQLDGGPRVALDVDDATIASRPTFLAPPAGTTLQFQLVVIDAAGVASAPATCAALIEDQPTAQISPSQVVVPPGRAVTLSGGGSRDPDPTQTLRYAWSLLFDPDAGPPPVALPADAGATLSFTAPSTAGISLSLSLVVTNGYQIASAPALAQVFVVAGPFPPVVDAGPDLQLDWSQAALLSPHAFDPDGDALSFAAWILTPVAPANTCGSLGTESPDSGAILYTAPAANCDAIAQVVVTDPNPLGPESTTATVGIHVRDRQPVEVAAASPQGTGPAFGPVDVTFARPIEPATLDGGLRVGTDAGALAGTIAYDPTSLTASFIPRVPFPVGVPVSVAVQGVVSDDGLGMADGGFAFAFTALPPTVQALEYPFQPPTASAFGVIVPFTELAGVLSGPGDEVVFPWPEEQEFYNFILTFSGGSTVTASNDDDGVPGVGPWNYFNPGPPETLGLRVDNMAAFIDGNPWFGLMDLTGYDAPQMNCTAGIAQQIVMQASLPGSPRAFMPEVNPGVVSGDGGAVYPGADCRVTQYAASSVDPTLGALVGTIDWVGADGGHASAADGGSATGYSQVRAFACPTCLSLIDFTSDIPVPGSAWAPLPPPAAASAHALSAVSMDARGQPLALAWIDQGQLHGAVLDADGGAAWRVLSPASGTNLAAQSAAYPTARWIGPNLWIAYYTAGASLGIQLIELPNGSGPPVAVGGPTLISPVVEERLSLVGLQDTVWISWDAQGAGSVGQQPHVAWYDPQRQSWGAPQGASLDGALPLDTGCSADVAALSPQWTGAGVTALFSELCAGSTAAAVVVDVQ